MWCWPCANVCQKLFEVRKPGCLHTNSSTPVVGVGHVLLIVAPCLHHHPHRVLTWELGSNGPDVLAPTVSLRIGAHQIIAGNLSALPAVALAQNDSTHVLSTLLPIRQTPNHHQLADLLANEVIVIVLRDARLVNHRTASPSAL